MAFHCDIGNSVHSRQPHLSQPWYEYEMRNRNVPADSLNVAFWFSTLMRTPKPQRLRGLLHQVPCYLQFTSICQLVSYAHYFKCLAKNISAMELTQPAANHQFKPQQHDHVIKWKHFPRYWPSVRGIHRSPVNSPHKGQWHGALIISLICAWINSWVNNSEADDLRRHLAHYDVIIMGRKLLPQRGL